MVTISIYPPIKRFAPLVLAALLACPAREEGAVRVSGQIEVVGVSPGSRVGGRVADVLVKEGDAVKAGDVLVRLEPHEAEALVAAAEAQLAQAGATLAKLEAGPRPETIKQAEAAVARAEAEYMMALEGARSQEIEAARATAESARAARDDARVEYERLKALYEQRAVSKQLYDQSLHRFEAAQSQYKAALERLDLLVEGTRDEQIAIAQAAFAQAQASLEELRNGSRPEDIAAARAARDAARAELQRAKVTLQEMTVVSPRDGVVESIDVEPGDLVGPGPIARIVDPEYLELRVYVSAHMLGRLRLGQEVELTTDSHGPERFRATIAFIAREGEFTPRNLQTEEERVQQVFAVKLNLDSHSGKLRAGMTATAHFK